MCCLWFCVGVCVVSTGVSSELLGWSLFLLVVLLPPSLCLPRRLKWEIGPPSEWLVCLLEVCPTRLRFSSNFYCVIVYLIVQQSRLILRELRLHAEQVLILVVSSARGRGQRNPRCGKILFRAHKNAVAIVFKGGASVPCVYASCPKQMLGVWI